MIDGDIRISGDALVSIIVPVYNTEKYLSKCIESILAQTYSYFEIILVDDGSTDGSGNLCDYYAEKDNRFSVIHQQNRGVSSARNRALDAAKGEWICFCDADDMLYPHALQTLIGQIDANTDCSMGGYVRSTPEGEILTEDSLRETLDMSIEEALIDFYKPNFKMYNGYIWNRLFKRSIIEKYHLRFREDIFIKEDGLFVVQYLCRCLGRVVFTKEPIYKYVVHDDSAVNVQVNQFNSKVLTRLYATIECYKEIKNKSFQKVLPYAKNYIFYVRDDLLKNDPKTGFGKWKDRWLIDGIIIKEFSPLFMMPLVNRSIRTIIGHKTPHEGN